MARCEHNCRISRILTVKFHNQSATRNATGGRGGMASGWLASISRVPRKPSEVDVSHGVQLGP